jgi:hypothetical protein
MAQFAHSRRIFIQLWVQLMYFKQKIQLFSQGSEFGEFPDARVAAQLMFKHVPVYYGYCLTHFLFVADRLAFAAAQLAVHPYLYAALTGTVRPLAFVNQDHLLIYCEEAVLLGQEEQPIDSRTAEAFCFYLS